ncbi:MAG: type II toxin-antitoxin system PemK/MazF family toxin [Acidobacteriota bacterium]|jgi:mRNA interferase MazF
MTIYNRGEVVVVNVPFSNGIGTKPRPALIISNPSFHGTLPDVIVCPISSQPRYHTKPGPGDCPIREWQSLKLLYASTVRVSKILSVDKKIIGRKLGIMARTDIAKVESALCAALVLRRLA